MHCPEYVSLGRLAHGVLLVICQENHVLSLVVEMAVQVGAHVLHVVDATAELSALAEVVDADEQGFPAAVAGRVLEGVAVGRAVAEPLRGSWWWRGTARAVVLLLGCTMVSGMSGREEKRRRCVRGGALYCCGGGAWGGAPYPYC